MVELHPAALAEVNAATAGYAERDPAVARAFAAEVKAALKRIQEGPERWPAEGAKIRRVLLHRFPFKIVYTSERQRLLIVAVAHTRRRPGYWADRI